MFIPVSASLQGTGVKMKYEAVQFEKLIRCQDGAQWFIVYLLLVGTLKIITARMFSSIFLTLWHSATQYTRIYATCYVPLQVFQWLAKGIVG